MPLTDTAIKQAKPADKPRKLADSDGLYIVITPSGGKLWRYDYRHQGKRKTLSLGKYPDLSLKAARKAHQQARERLAAGDDPAFAKQVEKAASKVAAANSLQAVALEWHETNRSKWGPGTCAQKLRVLESDLFPWLGSRPIAEVSAPEILAALRRIEASGRAFSAHRAKQLLGQVFRYGIATGRCDRDPAADLKGALAPVPPAKHMAAILEPAKVGELMRSIEGFTGSFPVRCALKLAPMLFCRPGELRKMQWADLDLDAAEWRYSVSKTNTEHLVPLSHQAIAILRELQPLTGHGQYVFRVAQDHAKPMSENTVNAALRRMGYDTQADVTGHGFRAMARTILHETLGFAPEVIEHQLAHSVPDMLGTAYNRTKFIGQRVKMMQSWADHLDSLREGAKVISIRA